MSGEIPPPRKAAARSLVHPSPSSPQLPSPLHTPQMVSPGLRPQSYGIQGARMSYTAPHSGEIEHLRMLLREEVAKNQTASRQYSICEEELANEKSKTQGLVLELQALKQKKQLADSDLAQSTADYMNAQAKLMEQVDSLNSEVQSLRLKLTQSSEQLAQAAEEHATLSEDNARLAERAQAASDEARREHAKRVRPDNVQVAANDLERRQSKLLIHELKSCHVRFKAEIEELKAVNARLVEENENFQVLLVERTVAGATLADEEFESDPETPQRQTATPEQTDQTPQPSTPQPSTPQSPRTASPASAAELQRVVNAQKFEIHSLQNHNRALQTSLERLIDRMLNNSIFASSVEEAVSKPAVARFRSRVSSHAVDSISDLNIAGIERVLPQNSTKPAQPGAPNIHSAARTQGKFQSPQLWSKLIINSQYTGSPNRRAFSLGVDDEAKGPVDSLPSKAFRRRNPSVASIERK